jgi:hypothetical protein
MWDKILPRQQPRVAVQGQPVVGQGVAEPFDSGRQSGACPVFLEADREAQADHAGEGVGCIHGFSASLSDRAGIVVESEVHPRGVVALGALPAN